MEQNQIDQVLEIINKDFNRAEHIYVEILENLKKEEYETLYQGVRILINSKTIRFLSSGTIMYIDQTHLDKYIKFLDFYARIPDCFECEVIEYGKIVSEE